MTVEIGEPAPPFSAQASNGKTVELTDFSGKWLILYFYPRDETPGCTREACSFRDSFGRIESLGATVIGCSPDDLKAHDKFIAHHDLPFLLISDSDHSISTAYGVWKEKNMYGRKIMGIERSTFLIDPKGNVARIWRKVKVEAHVDDIMDELKASIA
jgi:peroxiredoxin Q/BCP